ncbi:uncharacterized protein LOC111131299 isoform X1 [Crassostrea virginica]
MDGNTKNFSEISVTSPQRRESSCRAVSINAAAFSNFQNDPLDSCHRENSGSRNAASRLSEKSVLPVSITNSPRQQASDTSTQIFSLNSSISEPVCRICHGTSNTEQLMSLCYCAGTIGLMHVSCLQRWLGSSNKTQCELCRFNFAMERKPKPFYVYLCNPGSRGDRRRLMFDVVCISLLSPITLTVVSLCLYGATRYSPHRAEFVGLFVLGSLLLTLFIVWLVICLRINIKKWQEWKQFNQKVKLKCSPPTDERIITESTIDHSFQSSGIDISRKGSQMGVKISSIEIKVITEGQSAETGPRLVRAFDDSLKKTSRKSALNSISRPLPQTLNTNTPVRRYVPADRDQLIGNYYISSSSSKESASTVQHGNRVPPHTLNGGSISCKGRLYAVTTAGRSSPEYRQNVCRDNSINSREYRQAFCRDSSLPFCEYRQSICRDSSLPTHESNCISGSRVKPSSYQHYNVKSKGYSDYDSSIVYPPQRYI